MGNALLMGRKTFESIGKALPGRQTIVLSQSGFEPPDDNIAVINSLSKVPEVLEQNREVMVVGGAQIYRAALPLCRRLWLTRVLAEVEGDVEFPTVNWAEWELESSESVPAGDKDQWDTEFQRWIRK